MVRTNRSYGSMAFCRCITEVLLSSYALRSAASLATRVTPFQPPPSYGFMNSG